MLSKFPMMGLPSEIALESVKSRRSLAQTHLKYYHIINSQKPGCTGDTPSLSSYRRNKIHSHKQVHTSMTKYTLHALMHSNTNVKQMNRHER